MSANHLLVPPDAAITAIANGMPGGLSGFCKDWGYLQFGKEVAEFVIGRSSEWVGVDERLPEGEAETDVPVWTWDGVTMRPDVFGPIYIRSQPLGSFVKAGNWFRQGGYFDKRVTHWLPRVKPTPPAKA